MCIMENKESFQARIQTYFSPTDQLDIKLAYYLAKYGHRAQFRKEEQDGKPLRYFEHVRRVSIILIDEMKIMDKEMIIAALLHDAIEDTQDLTPEMLEHCFGSNVTTLIQLLSKSPKEGYHERLINCKNWKALAIKACDRLDNLRSLICPGTTAEFQKKQIKETEEIYFPIFNSLLVLAPEMFRQNVLNIRDEIRNVTIRNKTIIELSGA
jgi:guanosine-3',5'-bis(diphosphate) 3'-pyrophosphohydrolase